MIAFIRGILEEVTVNTVVIDCGGVGYELFVPQSVFRSISRVGEEVKLHTYMQVREDAVTLFGFADKDELELFKLLITVSGIGPKGAISILSTVGADNLRFAVLADDAKTIAASPGIGIKTAGKLILELKDKLKLMDAFESKLAKTLGAASSEVGTASASSASAGSASEERTALMQQRELQNEAVMALVSLGYSQTDALKAVKRVVVTEGMDVSDILKASLREM